MTQVKLYGRDDCGKTADLRNLLEQHDIAHHYFDLEKHPHARRDLLAVSSGRLPSPSVVIAEQVLREPTYQELMAALRTHLPAEASPALATSAQDNDSSDTSEGKQQMMPVNNDNDASDTSEGKQQMMPVNNDAQAVGDARAIQERRPKVREVLDHAESGAPAAGKAVRDIFSTDEIFQRILATADEEFSRSTRLLFLSGLAAGLSIGLSFVARAAITALVGGTEPSSAATLIGNMFYPTGFLLIVIGRYQLFTENTLTPVTLVLTKIASVPLLLKVWGTVLTANVLGSAIIAWLLATTGVLEPDAMMVARGFGQHALEVAWLDLFWKGVFAGWLVASMVWLIHAVRESITRFVTVFVLMSLVPSLDLFHCIIGACEVLFLVFLGEAGWYQSSVGFFLPVLLGNVLGGVLLVAILNYSQTRDVLFADRDCATLELTWREWLFGHHSGHPKVRRALQRGVQR